VKTESEYHAKIEEVSPNDFFVYYLKGMGWTYQLIWNSYFAEEFGA